MFQEGSSMKYFGYEPSQADLTQQQQQGGTLPHVLPKPGMYSMDVYEPPQSPHYLVPQSMMPSSSFSLASSEAIHSPTENVAIPATTSMATRNQRSQSKYKPPVKSNPLLDGLQFAPIARNLQVSSIYILFICGFTALVMIPTDPIWLSYIPGAYCILLSFVLYVWCFVSEFNKEDKLTVEEILNPKQWPQPLRKVLSAMNRNEVQCVLCFFFSIYSFFCVQTAIAGMCLVFSSIFFLVASIRKEKPIKITGII